MNDFKNIFTLIKTHPLAKRHLFTAYFNYLKWQLKSRLLGKIHIVKWIDPLKVVVQNDLDGMEMNFYTGLRDFSGMGFLLHFLNENDVFFDIGANVGSYTLLASCLKNVKCYSFEPNPTSFKILLTNVTINNLSSRVNCTRTAIGAGGSHMHFQEADKLLDQAIGGEYSLPVRIEVPRATLDEYSSYNPSVIKMDVRGSETDVLDGGLVVLQQNSVEAIILNLGGTEPVFNSNAKNIHNRLYAFGFEPYTYDPFRREFIVLERMGGANAIYIRDIEKAKKRVKISSPFFIWGETI